MKKNDKIELSIIDMTKDGLGLAKASGQVFFIKDGLIGDKVCAIITKIDNNIIYAKALNIIEESPYRVKSSCPIANACGGCQLLNLEYNKQIEIKKNYVLSCLKKIAKIENIEISKFTTENNYNNEVLCDNSVKEYIYPVYDGVIDATNTYNFRNKMQVPFSKKNDKIIYGFYASRTHSIIECEKCVIGFIGSDIILKSIKDSLEKYNISIYDENTHKGVFREVMLRKGNTSNEVSITYILNDNDYNKNLSLYRDFDNCVVANYNNYFTLDSNEKLILTTSTININTNANNVIFGNKNIVIRGKGYIEDNIGSIKYHISPESFYQVNSFMTKKLYDTIVEFGNFSGKENVFDLYCGIGTISLYIAKYVKSVLGIEIVEKAIENAIENAKLNNIMNVKFLCKDLSSISKNGLFSLKINDDSIKSGDLTINSDEKIVLNNESCDTIIVDPPRKGLDNKTISFIKSIKPKSIIYVSCDPATLSRDLKLLCVDDRLYRLIRIKNVDMFPHTMHIETVCLIKRNE